jgi:endo-1,4-beta-xylanase
MGQAYYDLVFNKWTTKLNKKTDDKGTLSDRGFYGDYEFTIKQDGKIFKGTFQVLPNDVNKLKINLQ